MNTTTFPRHVSSLSVFLTASFLIHMFLLFMPFASSVLPKTTTHQNRLIAVELLMPKHKTEKKQIKSKIPDPALLQPKPKQSPVKKALAAPAPASKEAIRKPAREATVSLDRLREDDMPYRSYIGHLRSKIGVVWEGSDVARNKGINGVVTIRFSINRNGSLQALTIKKNSPHQLLDNEALRIIKTAAPFSPFPSEFSIEILHVTASFEYEFNQR